MKAINLIEQLAKLPANSKHINQLIEMMDDATRCAYQQGDMDAIRNSLSEGKKFANEIAVALDVNNKTL